MHLLHARDLLDLEAVTKAVAQGFDGVLHFAALALVAESVDHPERYHRGNFVATLNLLDAMRAATGIPRTFRSVFWHDERQREESLMCHRRLVAAFSARDAELAEAVMRMHILGAIAFLEETWPKNH